MNGLKNFSINKKNKDFLKLLIGVPALLVLLFILNLFSPQIKNYFYVFSSPIERTFWSAGESSSFFLGSFLNPASLAKQNKNLEIENQRLLSEVVSLQSLVRQNQAQSDISATCQNCGFNFIMAGVIGLGDNDIISIDKGSADGISEGMPVISPQSVLFGKVFKVYKNFSEIMLISNKNSVVKVKILQDQNNGLTPEIDGAIKGSGELSAYLDLIPISSEINPQDVLVTSEVENLFPKDLLVGKIIRIEKNDQKPFQQAKIDLFFDTLSSDNLFIITNYK